MNTRQEGIRWIRERLAWEARLSELRQRAALERQATEAAAGED